MNSIGKEFMEKTKEQYLESRIKTRCAPAPWSLLALTMQFESICPPQISCK